MKMTIAAKSTTGVVIMMASIQALASYALGGYPGTFYHIMMRLNQESRKNPRIAPSPNRLWAILDPPASLGSLGGSSIDSSRIIRSIDNYREDYMRQATSNESPDTTDATPVTPDEGTSGERSDASPDTITTVLPNETPPTPDVATDVTPLGSATSPSPVTPETTTSAGAPTADPSPGTPTVDPSQVTPAADPSSGTPTPDPSQVTPETEPSPGTPTTDPTPDTLGDDPSPVTTEAPIMCSGDLNVTLDPLNLNVTDGQIFRETIETPGWTDGEYPEDFECEWNINIGGDCIMGAMHFAVEQGYIRSSAGCKEDYLKVKLPGGPDTKYCGPVVSNGFQVSALDLWTLSSQVPRTTQLVFHSASRKGSSGSGTPRGVQIDVIVFCWAYSEDFLSRTTTAPPPVEASSPASLPDSSLAVATPDPSSVTASSSSPVTSPDPSSVTASNVSPVASLDPSPVTTSGSSAVTTSGSSPVTMTASTSSPSTTLDPSPVTTSGSSPSTTLDPSPVTTSGLSPETTIDPSPVITSGSTTVTTSDASTPSPVAKLITDDGPSPDDTNKDETENEPNSVLGDNGVAAGSSSDLIPDNLIASLPATPIAPAGASVEEPIMPIIPVGANAAISSGTDGKTVRPLIPIAPLRIASINGAPPLTDIDTEPIINQLLNNLKRKD